MATKLTLYIDDDLANEAKLYAKKKGVSLSKVVNDFFHILGSKNRKKPNSQTPITKKLKGIIKDQKLSEKDYKKYLEKKYL